MTYEEKLLEAIEYWESLGNTIEEFGVLLAVATTGPELRSLKDEERNTARMKIRALPHGMEILEKESQRIPMQTGVKG